MGNTRCGLCRHYVSLEIPYRYDKAGYPSGVIVYGFCAKDAASRGNLYPVYLPDGGACKDFYRLARRRREKTACAEQLKIPEAADANPEDGGQAPQREDYE